MLASDGTLYVSYGTGPGPSRMSSGGVWKLKTATGAARSTAIRLHASDNGIVLRWALIAGLLIPAAASASISAGITVDYPEPGSIFPPDIAPPTFLWRDGAGAAALWRIEISFADGSPAIHTTSRGERIRIGRVDPDCVSPANELPRLTPQQAAAHTWTPDATTWAAIKKHSVAGPATVAVAGFSAASSDLPVSRGRVAIRTSRDPVGAPIFYRDVPLMPTQTREGVIQPLAATAVRLIQWRLRNIAESRSRVVMEEVPVCAQQSPLEQLSR